MEEFAHRAAESVDRPLVPEQLERLTAYSDRLYEANQRFNLTAIRDRQGIKDRLVLDSLRFVRILEAGGLLPKGSAVIDVGSGGGIPGLPMAIVRPGLRMTLLEATGKKAAFLQETAEDLGLARVRALHARAEDAAHDPALRARFDLAVARAVASLDALVELTLPFVRTGGRLAAIKGERAGEELEAAQAAIARCGGGNGRLLELPSVDGAEPVRVVVVDKRRATPADLPRRAGLPAKSPLR